MQKEGDGLEQCKYMYNSVNQNKNIEQNSTYPTIRNNLGQKVESTYNKPCLYQSKPRPDSYFKYSDSPTESRESFYYWTKKQFRKIKAVVPDYVATIQATQIFDDIEISNYLKSAYRKFKYQLKKHPLGIYGRFEIDKSNKIHIHLLITSDLAADQIRAIIAKIFKGSGLELKYFENAGEPGAISRYTSGNTGEKINNNLLFKSKLKFRQSFKWNYKAGSETEPAPEQPKSEPKAHQPITSHFNPPSGKEWLSDGFKQHLQPVLYLSRSVYHARDG